MDLLDENIYKVSKEQRIGANKESIQKIKGIISKDNTKEFSVGKMILGSQEHSIQNSKDINEESKNITEDNSNKISEEIVVLGSLEQEIKDNKKNIKESNSNDSSEKNVAPGKLKQEMKDNKCIIQESKKNAAKNNSKNYSGKDVVPKSQKQRINNSGDIIHENKGIVNVYKKFGLNSRFLEDQTSKQRGKINKKKSGR